MLSLFRWASVFILGISLSVLAADVTWDGEGTELTPPFGPDDDWDNDDNWDTDSEPGSGDHVIIDTAGPPGVVHLVLQAATVSSINCKAPFRVDSTLFLSAPSEFSDSFLPDGEGAISSSSTVTLKGNNDARRIGFQGSGTFENQGMLILEDDVASANFINNNLTVVNSGGNLSLHKCVNNGTMAFGENVFLSGSSSITNNGNITIGGTISFTSVLDGKITQQGGVISVGENKRGRIVNGNQSYQGGTINVDEGGELILTYGSGSLVRHEFDGLEAITGSGDLKQRTDFEVKQDLNLNITAPGTYSADALDIQSGVTLMNSGRMDLLSSATLSGDGLFKNNGRLTGLMNSTIDVRMENNDVWLCGSFRIGSKDLVNRAQMQLQGGTQKATKTSGIPGRLINDNFGRILVYNGLLTYTIEIPFEQSSGGRTHVLDGDLRFFSTTPPVLGGTFEVDAGSELEFWSPARKTDDVVGAEDITFEGEGTVYIGQVAGASIFDIYDEDTIIANAAAFRQERSDMILHRGARIENRDFYAWKGGKILSTETLSGTREIWNKGIMQIEPGATKWLGVRLKNGTGKGQPIYQFSTITLLDGSTTDGTGQIINEDQSTWFINNICSILGRVQTNPAPSQVSFLNEGVVQQQHPGTSSIVVDFLNKNAVSVQQGALTLQNLHNLADDGTMNGGRWFINPGATLNLPRTVTSLRNGAKWYGKTTTITNIGSDVKSEKGCYLELRDGSLSSGSQPIRLGKNSTLVTPLGAKTGNGQNIFAGGFIRGRGQIKADITYDPTALDFSDDPGIMAPGTSPGTLTIDGNLTFGFSEYEWETQGITNGGSDLLVVTNGTATLAGGIVPIVLEGYTPAPGTVFTAVVANAISGTFDYVSFAKLPTGQAFTVNYSPTTVTLTAGTTNFNQYADWREANFSPVNATNDLVSGHGADPEGDLFSNLAEYAHGLGPAAMDEGVVSISQAVPEFIDLHFPWVDGLTDVGYSVVASPDIDGVYTNIPHSLVDAVSDGTISETTIRIAIPPSAPHLFLQLQITEQP